jgi:hypothetical protein
MNTPNTPTIIVAEDHPMFRAALVLTLKRLMPEAVLIEAASHGELEQALARSGDVKLVLLDLRMPGAHGLSSLADRPIARLAPWLKRSSAARALPAARRNRVACLQPPRHAPRETPVAPAGSAPGPAAAR